MSRQEPDLAREVVEIVDDILGDTVVGAYRHGSAVLGGLRPTSDVDVLAVIARPTSIEERRALVDRLLGISGRRAYRGPARPVELTIVVDSEIRPWRYPPRAEFQYGEWLRDAYEAGSTPEPGPSPDLAPLLAAALAGARVGAPPLRGPALAELVDPVPPADLRRAIVEGVPGLLADLASDTRNVLLTLARIWFTLATGEISPKDVAAAWAIERLPAANADARAVLETARRMYLDGIGDDEATWAGFGTAVQALADALVTEIRRLAPP
jgi:predicted nucleotidyltransferase